MQIDGRKPRFCTLCTLAESHFTFETAFRDDTACAKNANIFAQFCKKPVDYFLRKSSIFTKILLINQRLSFKHSCFSQNAVHSLSCSLLYALHSVTLCSTMCTPCVHALRSRCSLRSNTAPAVIITSLHRSAVRSGCCLSSGRSCCMARYHFAPAHRFVHSHFVPKNSTLCAFTSNTSLRYVDLFSTAP